MTQGLSFVPSGHLGPGWIVVVVLGVLGAGFGSILVASVSLFLGLRRARAEERALLDTPVTTLRPGPRRIVRGKVERTGSAEAPVEVDIVEIVHDHTSKQNRWHTWEETERTVRAEPFRLLREDGGIVKVEPGQDVLVVDALTTAYPPERPLHRVRSAIIAHGAEVFVYGDLHRVTAGADGPYRESGSGFAIRPPRNGAMLIATESLRERHDAVIRTLGAWLAAGVVAFALFHAAVTLPFLLTSAFHTDDEAWVEDAHIKTTSTKNGPSYTYLVTVRTDDGFRLEEQSIASPTYFRATRDGRGNFVPHTVRLPIIRTWDRESLSFVGKEPHVSVALPLVALLVFSLIIIIAFFSYRQKLAWYDMKKVTEHGGDGHWTETRPTSPIDPSVR